MAFSAIENLSDELPVATSDPSGAIVDSAITDNGNDKFADRHKTLLQTLEELAGPDDVRVEDTGVEWRVVENNEASEQANEADIEDEAGHQETDDDQASLEPGNIETSDSAASPSSKAESQQEAAPGLLLERRYDDDTPLTEDFAAKNDLITPPVTETAAEFPATGQDSAAMDLDTGQIEMVLVDDDDWSDLLDDDQGAGAGAEDNSPQTDATEANLTTADDLDSQFNLQTEAMGLDVPTGEAPGSMTTAAPVTPETGAQAASETPGEEEEDEGFAASTAVFGDYALDQEGQSTEDSDEDELSPEEEADIVQKLRESTGSFQKQIKAAQRALDQGDVDVSEEPAEAPRTPGIGRAGTQEAASAVDEIEYAGLLQHAVEEAIEDPDTEADTDTDADADADEIDIQISISPEPRDSLDMRTSGDEPLVPPQTEIDLLSQTMIQAGIDPTRLDTENIETIVLEGDFVVDSLESESSVDNEFGKQEKLVDTYMLNKQQTRGGRRKSDPAGFGVIAGVVVLVAALLAQYIHASRQTFATYDAFNQILGPVYRALGKPVTPQWNIKGWQFESTSGSTDENEAVLTVFSRIRNASDKPLPYPLVHLSLTDRWEEIIGSKVLGPSEYLAGDLDPRQSVAPGDAFTAVIAIEAPSPEATGFQLYACYRTSPGHMRCATEDFRN